MAPANIEELKTYHSLTAREQEFCCHFMFVERNNGFRFTENDMATKVGNLVNAIVLQAKEVASKQGDARKEYVDFMHEGYIKPTFSSDAPAPDPTDRVAFETATKYINSFVKSEITPDGV